MNFASYDFWKLLFLCFVGSRLILAVTGNFFQKHHDNASKLCLLATGLILLGCESWLTLIVFLWVVGLSWIGVLVACRPGFDRRSLISGVIFVVLLTGQLAPLFYYKYWTFVMNEWLGLGLKQPSVLIPMGLSFYTFQKIGFWLDTVRNPGTRPKLLDYLNFCSFFPQIVAGPIEKKASLLPQIENTGFKIHRANIEPALRWIVLGLAYKMVVADNLGLLPEKFHVDASNPWHIWLECLTFGMRIYFDFAGYSFVAIGLGLVLGVELTLNFRCPYWSANLREFWRNWHITLGAWLRDYVYLPLGGRKSRRWVLNTLIVFLISGIWHGAGWGFVIWGLLHGIGVAASGTGKLPKIPWPVRWAVTFAYTTAAWLFFMESDTTLLREKAFALVDLTGYGLAGIKAIPNLFAGPLDAITLALILTVAFIALLAEGLGMRLKKEPYHFGRASIVSACLVFLIVFLAPMEESRFIYFNF